MREFIQIGGLAEHQNVVEELALPIIPEFGAVGRVADALDQVVVMRRGAAVVGPKGCGKSFAVQIALRDFADGERRKYALDGKYKRRSIYHLRNLRGKNYRDAAVSVLKGLTGGVFTTAARGRRKTDDELREETVLHCLDQCVVAIAFDEAENASSHALDFLRDVMSDAEDMDSQRFGVTDHRTGGVGVLLLGTRALGRRLAKSSEAGQRWFSLIDVGQVLPEHVAGIYECWFPSFAAHVDTVGRGSWQKFITEKVSHSRATSFRELENHARLYFRRLARKEDTVRSRDDATFQEQLFLLTLAEARWVQSADDVRGRNNAA